MRKNLLSLLAIAALPGQLFAQSYADLAQVELRPGWRETADRHIAAVEITLAPGWVTYWRAPGDAGIPPTFVFSGSRDIMSITPLWPTPEVFGDNGMRSIGSYDSVVVPVVVRLNTDTPQNVDLSGEMTIGVCEEICIPVTLTFDALLPMTGAPDGVIRAALADRPMSQQVADVGDVTCALEPIADGLRMTASIDLATTGASEHVVVETGDPRVWVSEADSTRDGQTLRATVDMVHPSGQPFALDRSGVRITVLGTDRAVDIQGCSAN